MEFLFSISSKNPNAIFFDKDYATAYLVGVGIGLSGALTAIGQKLLTFMQELGIILQPD